MPIRLASTDCRTVSKAHAPDQVGRTPRSAADALVALCGPQQQAGRGAGCRPGGLPHKASRRSGMTLIELIVACTIMMLLTYMAVPMARSRVRREKERELRTALGQIRTAIDQYKDHADRNEFGPIKVGTEGYPETLEILVEGVKIANQVDKKVKFLRRIPLDPMTNKREWGKRSMQDDPKSTAWGGQNVFDVYTNSFDKARDGTPYSEW
jgi:general secretion pathway protein G